MNIITALNNPNINKKLKEKTSFNIIGNDIQYQEGILEMLNQNEEINLIIISELLPGEINFKELIYKIKSINKNLEIIVFLNKENEELKNYLIAKGVFNIFKNNEITVEKLIEIINKKNSSRKEIEINEEIQELKKIILEKEKKKINIKNFSLLKKIKENNFFRIIKSKIKFKTKNIKSQTQIISIVGPFGVGKSSFCTLFAKLVKNKKILIIDFDILNSSINSIFNVKIYPKKIKDESTNNIKDLIIKYSKNINLLCATKILVDSNFKKIKNNFEVKFNELKKEYDLIIIDNSSECFFDYTKEILKLSDLIIFLTEPNLTELKKSKNLLNIYINNWDIKKDKINIAFSKTNKNSIYDKILNTLFGEFKILGKIKINIDYNLIINRNVMFISKKIKREYLKIIKEVVYE